MKMLRKMFAPKEVQIALAVLDEVGLEFNCEAFRVLKNRIEDDFLADCNMVVSEAAKGTYPSQQAYFAVANLAGDCLASGWYHIYRGVLDSVGQDLLTLFDVAVDRLVQSGAIAQGDARAQKAAIRERIESVG